MMHKLAILLLIAAVVPVQAQQPAGHKQLKPKAATTTVRFGVNGHDQRVDYPL